MDAPDVEVYRALSAVLSQIGVSWYVFGGQAAILHGATRFTEDVDITVHLDECTTRQLVTALTAAGFALRVEDPLCQGSCRLISRPAWARGPLPARSAGKGSPPSFR